MDLGSNSGSATSCVLTSEPVFPHLCDGVSQAYVPGKLLGLNEIVTKVPNAASDICSTNTLFSGPR